MNEEDQISQDLKASIDQLSYDLPACTTPRSYLVQVCHKLPYGTSSLATTLELFRTSLVRALTKVALSSLLERNA